MDTGQSCLVGWDSKLQMLYYKQQTGILNNNKSISKTQKFVHGDHSKCTHVYTYTYTYSHTHAHTHTHTHGHLPTLFTTYMRLRYHSEQGLKAMEDSSMRVENLAGLLFWKKKCPEVRFAAVQRGFLSERKGQVIPFTHSNLSVQRAASATTGQTKNTVSALMIVCPKIVYVWNGEINTKVCYLK